MCLFTGRQAPTRSPTTALTQTCVTFSLQTQSSRATRSRLVDTRCGPLCDDERRHQVNTARTRDPEIVNLATFRPRIPRFVRRHLAILVVPLDRSRDHCDRDQPRMGMPSVITAGRIGRILNHNRRGSLRLQESPKLATGSRELTMRLDIGILTPTRQDRRCQVENRVAQASPPITLPTTATL